MLASSAPHSPSATTAASAYPAISDSLLRQDSKDAITKSTHLVKLIGKHRIALGSVAQTMADMGDALADLGRARAVRVAERSTPHGLNRDAMRNCGEFHITMAKRIREYTDRILRELEEPLQNSIDEHAHTVTSNEKRLAHMEREISDKVKKSEMRTKKKWNRDAAQAEQATRDLARYTLELSDLKFHNQNIIVGEEARHVRVMEDQWAALLRSLSGLLGKSLTDASACLEKLSDSSKGSSSASSARKGGLYGNNAPIPASALRRGSLDSNMGDVNIKPAEEKPSYNSLGRRVAKMVGAVSGSGNSHTPNSSISSAGSGNTSPRRGAGGERAASPRSNSTSPNGSSGTASPSMSSSSQGLGAINTTNLGAGQSTFPQLSLPSFSPLGSAPPSNPLAPQEQQHYQPAAAPRPIIKSANSSSNNASSSDKQRRVAFPTSKPIATVQQTPDQPITQGDGSQPSPSQQQSLSSLYPDIFAAENTHIAQTPVLAHRAIVRNPAVYVAGGEGDAESQIGSVVGTTESLVGVLPSGSRNLDLVYAIHDFDARSAKEMSLRKGDVMEVKKRHGTWIYGTKFSRRQKASDDPNSPAAGVTNPTARSASDRFRRGIPQDSSAEQTKTEKPEVGWIPMAFVAKFSAA
ncbi:hypothetical protein HDU87_002459 [Geranomyces variabilis]|uniref:SH3 domain-containing protein n=1 Tax=Geranomyces variabilis TaxID=109894 RepID=A0AAD5XNT5_9FUNG|nr:hypothetical protein HDU87_002459 [Geranomyces variabilis]